MKEKLIVSVASIYKRKNLLPVVINSIYNQADEIGVYLNDYPDVPEYLVDEKIKIYRGNIDGNLGDIGKFHHLKDKNGYLFTIDDDIVYPSNYIEIMSKCIEKYKRKAFICVHGNRLPSQKITSYYQEKKGVHFMNTLYMDEYVDVPGTGTLAYHSSLYSFSRDDFPIPNMSDIWLYRISKEKNISIVSVARPEKWLNPIIDKFDKDSIYAAFYKNDAIQTAIINQYRGEIYERS